MPLLTHIRTKSVLLAWGFGLILLLFPLGQHAVGAVLCIEADGHMSVEDAVGFSCGPYASAHQHGPSSIDDEPVADTHCGDCIDIPLPSSSDVDCAAFRLAPDVVLPALLLGTPVSRLEVPQAPHFPLVAHPRSEVPHNTPLLALRTVVLLN